MRILIMTAITAMALPFMAVGQTTEEPQQTQGQTKETQTKETQTGSRSTSQTNVNTNQTTTVNKEEFRTRHSEVFSLGRHPKDFFVQRYGASHFRLIGNSYFVFVDGCWVAVDVDGFTYTQRVVCQGDPDFVVIE